MTEQQRDRTLWEALVDRKNASANPLERSHLFFGVALWDDAPVFVDKALLYQHMYIRGATGSGKTSVGITPLLTQLIRQAEEALVVLDMKGDNDLRTTVCEESEKAGRECLLFTNGLHMSTHLFDPVKQTNVPSLSINQVAETFLEALNLNQGEGHPVSYFARRARNALVGALHDHPDIGSFEELHRLKRWTVMTHAERQEIFELLSVIESLASFPQLNMQPGGRKHPPAVIRAAINFDQVVEEKQIVYAWLPAAKEMASVREIAKLMVYALLSAHIRRSGPGMVPPRTILVLDEFQRIASEGFKIILEQARSLGIGCILANQTLQDLQTRDTNLIHTVINNTAVKQIFSESNIEEKQRLCAASGSGIGADGWWINDVTRKRYTPTDQPVVQARAVNQATAGYRLTENQVTTVSDDPFASILHVERGSGLSQFGGFAFPISLHGFSVTAETYERRRLAPWPEPTPETIVVTREPLQPEHVQGQRQEQFYVHPDAAYGPEDEAPDAAPQRRGRRGQKGES